MPPSKFVPRSASRSALITVVDGSTSCVVGGENPSDTLTYNKTPGIIFFDSAMRGASSLLKVLFTGSNNGTESLVMVMEDLLKLEPALRDQPPRICKSTCA